MRLFLGLAALLAAGTLGMGAAGSVPADAVAMGLGIVMGALITVPVSLMVVLGGTSEETKAEPGMLAVPRATQPPYPLLGGYEPRPLVLVNGATWSAQARQTRVPARLDVSRTEDARRRVQVIGEPAA